jgi:glycosyltransferase involved in cell wall biosynthesis
MCSGEPSAKSEARQELAADANVLSIFLLVRSLEAGGAERQLTELARGLKSRGHEVTVATFYRRGPLIAELEEVGVRIVDLRKRGRWDTAGFLWRTYRALREARPDILYSFLGGANIIAAMVAMRRRGTKLVWSIRASDMDLSRYHWLQSATFRFERMIARMPDLIIANSNAGRDYAVRRGFPASKIKVVANGIDVDRFRPDERLRSAQRKQWRIGDDEIAVGVLARLDPMKGHATFLRAAAVAAHQRRDMRFLCIGEGSEETQLKKLAAELGLERRVLFTGRTEAASALNALDVAVSSSSFGEGFSNAVAEAMACGLPCIVTDVGDSALVVGQSGTVVPRRDPEALAAALLDVAAGLPSHSAEKMRRRIVENFSVDTMVDQTLDLLRRTAKSPAS